MITVTNRILVKKGFGMKMAPAFTSGKSLLNWDGFHKVEVNVSTQDEAHDEMNVMMFWDSVAHFEAWRASDDFKNSHKREGNGNSENSPVIGSKIVIAEIASTLVK